jgi:hypothetical protein
MTGSPHQHLHLNPNQAGQKDLDTQGKASPEEVEDTGSDEESGDAEANRDWFYQQRAYPAQVVPQGAYFQAVQQAAKIQPAVQRNTPGINSTLSAWTFTGPNRSLDQYGSGTNYTHSGRVNAIAVDPTNSSVIYVGAANGGVWKTINGGTSWTSLTDNILSLSISALAVDPTNSNIIYAGTGDYNNYSNYFGTGILKSGDAGNSWSLLGSSIFNGLDVGKIIVNPHNNQDVLAATTKGLFRSLDGGTSWSQAASLTGLKVDALEINTNTNPLTVYVAATNSSNTAQNGIYRSTDGGTSFSGFGSGLPAPSSIQRMDLKSAPSNQAIMYLLASATSPQGQLLGVWKTTDNGNTWAKVSSATTPNFLGNQGWYGITMGVDPTNPQTIWAGGVDSVISTDGGVNWKYTYDFGWVDEHTIVFAPGNSSTLYIGDDGGIWRANSVNNTYWSGLNTNLGITQFYGAAAGPNFSSSPELIGGTQDNGPQLVKGTSLDWSRLEDGDGGYTAIDPSNPSTYYVETQYGKLHRYDNSLMTDISPPNGGTPGQYPFIAKLEMDPSNPQRLLIGGNGNIYQTTNRGASWTTLNSLVGASTALAIAPSDGKVIYASQLRSFEYTTNGGTSWQWVTGSLPNAAVTGIAIDRVDPSRAVVVLGGTGQNIGHVWLITNYGTTVTNISGSLPDAAANSVLIDPINPDTFYVGTDVGFFYTNNGGANWNASPGGLPKAPVNQLFFDPQFTTLFAATFGRGVYKLPLPPSAPAAPPNIWSTTYTDYVGLSWDPSAGQVNTYSIDRKLDQNGNYSVIGTVPGTANSFNDTTIIDGVRYYYRVQAVNSIGSSPYSDEVVAITAMKGPSNVTGFIQDTQVNLNWLDNSASETAYHVLRKTGLNGTYTQIDLPANSTGYQDKNLTENTTYYYKIQCDNSLTQSPYSNEIHVATSLKGPTGLIATTNSTNSISLNWLDNSQVETGYQVDRKIGTNGTWASLTSLGANANSYTDTGLDDSTTYYYRVRAVAGTNVTSSYSNIANATTLINAPTNLSATATSFISIKLTWTNNSSGASSFKIERRTGMNSFTEIAMVGAGILSYTDIGLVPSTTYEYQIRAYNNQTYSSYAGPVTAFTPAAKYLVDHTGDDGLAGSLSWAINSAKVGEGISFSVNLVTVSSSLPNLAPGVAIAGSCGNGPGVIIQGNAGTTSLINGLNLQGGNIVYGIRISGFTGYQIVASKGGSLLKCINSTKP